MGKRKEIFDPSQGKFFLPVVEYQLINKFILKITQNRKKAKLKK